jgi:arginyl-tRNA synthetase
MIDIKKRISENLLKIVKDLGVKAETVIVEEPTDFSHGDLTCNVALQVSKELNTNPREIAQSIVDRYPKDEDLEKIEVAGPGFINFSFSNNYLLKSLREISKEGEEFFKLDNYKGKKSVIEYTDPNPFKILHIGHLYTNMVGESFARLQEALGASVYRANYQGDVGLHVAKTFWGLDKLFERDGITFEELSNKTLSERVSYLGEAYVYGSSVYKEEEESAVEEIKRINYYIFSLFIPSLERKDFFQEFESINMKERYEKGRKWCLDFFEEIYKRVGTKFDYYFFEGDMGKAGLNVVLDNTDTKGKGIFTKDDGAIIYKGEESKGLHTRVFVNKEGLPTYEAKDLALAQKKFEMINYEESVIITGNEQSQYFKVVLDALWQLNSLAAERTKHFTHGLMLGPDGKKMGSRKGGVMEASWLLDETRSRVEKLMKESGKWSEEEISQISDKIAVGAVKYAFLKVTVGKDVTFDFDKSISFDGDTGPYLQYVYARCNSLIETGSDSNQEIAKKELDVYTKELLKVTGRYPVVLLASANNYSPSIMCNYLFDLGQSFNKFYQNVRVVDSKDKDFLLTVVKATAKTMKNGLNVLGIETVDHM